MYEEISLFSIKVSATVKTFTSQKSDYFLNANEPWELEVSTVAEFKQALWPKVRPHLKREIIFVDKNPTWSDKECPEEEDLDKFISIFDTKSRKTIELSQVSMSDLGKWSDERILTANICEYSTAVNSKAAWTSVEKKLIQPAERDKSGAAAEAEIGKLVDLLKSTHRYHYTAAYICWRQWADYLTKQPAHLREGLISKPPPSHLIHLFAHAYSDADALISEIRTNLNIGEGINEGLSQDLAKFRKCFDVVKKFAVELSHAVDAMDERLIALEQKSEINRENLSRFQEAVGPEENAFGIQMYSKIGVQDDVDHD